MAYVPSSSLLKLLCVECDCYLSHFPIYFLADKGSICGRCSWPNNNLIRNEAYELLAENQKFPCIYRGCLANLYPGEVPEHEKYCSFRKHQCPAICVPGCEWQGFVKDLLDHFEQKHATFLLKVGKFEIDFVNSHQENYLLPVAEDLFVVHRATYSKTSTFSCTVTYIGHNLLVDKYVWKLILKSGNLTDQHEILGKLNEPVVINSNDIRNILKDPLVIIAYIEVFQDTKSPIEEETEEYSSGSDVNYDILRDLECLVCMEYMVPPIHQCVTGHSICLRCKDTVSECPTCKEPFKNTQNFALAQIINHLIYPCKHDKCKFTAKAKDIKQHEATCIHGPFVCPLDDYFLCNADLTYTALYDHIVCNHYEHLLEMETVSVPFEMDKEIRDCFMCRYDGKLFKCHFAHVNREFYWEVQLIGPTDEINKYKFEVDIIDNSGHNSRVYFKKPCTRLTAKEEAFMCGGCVHLLDEQIEQLITTELTYRLRVIKE